MLKVDEIEPKNPQFRRVSLEELTSMKKEIKYSGFYLKNTSSNQYFFKVKDDDNFYIVEADSLKSLEDPIEKSNDTLQKQNQTTSNKPTLNIVSKAKINTCELSIEDLVALFRFDSNIKVDQFTARSNNSINSNYETFLKTIREVYSIEEELRQKNISYSDKYEIMKCIYDRYKTEGDYWNPSKNYGVKTEDTLIKHTEDENRIVNHPYDYLGLMTERYATCIGMADTLISLYRYFGINATMKSSKSHSICKISLTDENGEKAATYIDLSREIASDDFHDTKYSYENGVPKRNLTSSRQSSPDSYKFFMTRRAGNLTPDQDSAYAVDFNPTMTRSNTNSMVSEQPTTPKITITNIEQSHKEELDSMFEERPKQEMKITRINGIPQADKQSTTPQMTITNVTKRAELDSMFAERPTKPQMEIRSVTRRSELDSMFAERPTTPHQMTITKITKGGSTAEV